MTKAPVEQSVAYIREHIALAPVIGIILGSGLGDFADALPERTVISTSAIPHYPISTIEGHKGRLVFAALNKKPILAFQGRTHFYESRSLETVLYPIRVAHALGIRTLIVTNAAGGINRTYNAGDLMILTDQINLTLKPWSPPHSASYKGVGGSVYSSNLIRKAEEAASANGISVRKGVYAGLKGPTYETAAEVEMLSRIGADAVGMSTVFEASLASSMGMEVLGISCITNLATGIGTSKLSHAEVTEVGNRVKKVFSTLVAATIDRI
ncbi:MAG: purine-nucleoside phosphorylase [Bacteroidetes bacterium]|nr:purine-nucleoside phosphorylase [Bacteroidota bacterium]MCW5896965.1 purine-nucleoside phosphorylase [Bacteroidota bacterium]